MAALIIKNLKEYQINQLMILIENGKFSEWFNSEKQPIVERLTDKVSVDFQSAIVSFQTPLQ